MNVAIDQVTGQVLNEVFVGTFVPGSGDPANGMVTADDPSYPRGFRDTLAPAIEPRVGVAYDLFGDNSTKLHASAGVFHNAVLGGGSQGNLQGPPNFFQSSIFYNRLSTFMAPGTSLAQRPVGVNGLERHADTPAAYRYTAGVQRDIGWGTVVDVSYVGSINRHLEMQENINPVPDGAKFVDLHPENIDPRNGRALPDDFLRPYRGFQAINMRSNWGKANYNSLQVQVNRRYIEGLQFGAAYTYARAFGVGDDDPAAVSILRPLQEWYYAPLSSNQRHNLTINYTYDLPDLGKVWDHRAVHLLLDGWQLSGENAWVSGDWDDVSLSTTDGFDFTGGSEGARPVLVGDPMLPRSERDAETHWFNTAAFARPAGRGELRQHAAHRAPVAGHQQLEPRAVQELRPRRAAQVPVPRRGVQHPEHAPVQRCGSWRTVRSCGRAGQREPRHGNRGAQSANHADVFPIHVLRRSGPPPVTRRARRLRTARRRTPWVTSHRLATQSFPVRVLRHSVVSVFQLSAGNDSPGISTS